MTPCRRCGAELTVNLVGVISCRACVKREHEQVAALIAPQTQHAAKVHQRLLQVAEAQIGAAR